MSLSQLVQANGWFFGPLFLAMSFAAVSLVVLRIIKNYRARCDLDLFVEDLEQALQSGGGRAAYELCKQESTETRRAIPRMFFAAFEKGRQGRIAARDAIADCIETEIMPSAQSLLPIILLLAKISPMVGLLGTVSGMIGAFRTIAGATKVDPSALANDIGMALFTTAEGLIIAIPLILAYTIFQERLRRLEVELQRGAQEALRLRDRLFAKTAA